MLTALTGALILASTQFVFIRLLKTAYSDNDAAQESTRRLEKLLGLKDTRGSGASMRKELVLHDIGKLQKKFGLSDREAEVAALYALGKTQQAIAEELCITPATVRVHVKHVYAKTDLHSRQEIIDLMSRL